MTKREASRYIDELKNKNYFSEYRVTGESFNKLVEEQETIRRMNGVRLSAITGGLSATEFTVRKQSTADKYNELSKKYRLGVTYKARKRS